MANQYALYAIPCGYHGGTTTGLVGAFAAYLPFGVPLTLPALVGGAGQLKFPLVAATNVQGLAVWIDANNFATGVTVTLRKNGVDTTCVVAIGAGVTGYLSDLVHPQSFAAGDTYDLRVDNAGDVGKVISLKATLILGG